MSEARLQELLREVPVPDAEGAERRGLTLVSAAYEQRQTQHRSPLPRLALALAIASLLAALLLSPAGASVRHWVGDVFSAGVPGAKPGLTEIPGGGRLLVQTPAGPWVVQADGSRRLLGDYREASWSPRGLYVAAASGRTLTAVEPDGDPHWSLTAPGAVADPRWSPSGFRIAYRSGTQLRVVNADGSGDRLIDPRTRPVAVAWSPLGLAQLAYVGARGRLRFADSESGATIASAAALPAIAELEWGGGAVLLEASRDGLRIRRTQTHKLSARLGVGAPRALPLPAGSRLADAAISPDGRSVAALVRSRGRTGPRSAVLLFGVGGGEPGKLLDVRGRLTELAFAPDGRRLLVAWPEADQWLFLPTGRGVGRALAGIAAAFAPGRRQAPFPSLAGWCCHAGPGEGD